MTRTDPNSPEAISSGLRPDSKEARTAIKFVYQHCGGRYVILTFCDCDRVEKLIILQLETFDISNVIC